MPANKTTEKPATEKLVDAIGGDAAQAPIGQDKAKTEKKEKPLSKEALDGIAAFMSSEFPGAKIGPPKQPDDDKKAAEAEEEAEKAKEKEIPKETAKRKTPFKPKPAPKVEAPPALTAEQIAAAAAEGTTKALTAKEQSKSKEQEKVREKSEWVWEEHVVPDIKETSEILKRMETLFKDKPQYKDISGKYLRSMKALEDYAEKWEAENPGQKFDEDAPEHEDFFKKNDVDWSDKDFNRSVANMEAEHAIAAVKGESAQEIQALKQKLALQESQVAIANHQNSAATSYWSKLGDEFKDIVAPNGAVNHGKIEELKKTDPDGTAMRVRAAANLDLEVGEVHKLYNGLVDNDPKGNPIHAELNRFIADTEKQIAAKSIQERVDDQGRDFLPAAKYWSRDLTKADRERYWTLTADDVIALRVDRVSKLVTQAIDATEEQHRAWAKAHGIEIPEPASKRRVVPAEGELEDETPPEEHQEKPRSPSSAADSRAAASRGGKPGNTQTGALLKSIL